MTSVVETAVVHILTIFVICEVQVNGQIFYVPKIEPLDTNSLRLIIENTGFETFSFQGNINKPIKERDIGSLSHIVNIPTDTKVVNFTLSKIPSLNIGDTIYYYVYFGSTKGQHFITDLEFTVTKFYSEDDTPTKPDALPLTSGTSSNDEAPCTLSITLVKGHMRSCKGSLIFSEDFTQTDLRQLRQWQALKHIPNEPDYPFNMYDAEDTISIEDGCLVITPIFTDTKIRNLFHPLDLSDMCTGKINTLECKRDGSGTQMIPPVTTGKITTRLSFSFTYGRVEVRAKLPSGKWIIPEINLEPTDNVYGWENYSSGLVRIAFTRNGDTDLRKSVFSGPLFTGTEVYGAKFLETEGEEYWHKGFHNYSVTWTPAYLAFYVDGKRIGSFQYTNSFAEDLENEVPHAANWKKGSDMAPFDEMFHVTLGLRVGGVSEFNDSSNKPWKNLASKAMLNFWRAKDTWISSWDDSAMQIDYVKVYAL